MLGHKQRAEEDHDSRVWLAWHSVGWAKLEKMPKLADYLSKNILKEKAPSKGVDEAAIMARLKAYSNRFKVENS